MTISQATVIQVSGAMLSVAVGAIVWAVSLLYKDYSGKKDYRRAQILRWREAIHAGFEQLDFCDTVVFSEVRPHLSKMTLESIQGDKITVRIGRGGNLIKSLVLDDIANLEKKWGLI